jgi:phosphomannomutase
MGTLSGMTLDPAIFKAYDIRGLVPEQFDPDGAYRVARAYVEVFQARHIAIGHDMRLSSPALAEAAIRGATDGGANVAVLGEIGTEMLYFAVADGGLDGGIIITASHNPAEYNGMKIVRAEAQPVGSASGLNEVKKLATGPAELPTVAAPGSATPLDVLPAYAAKMLGLIDVPALRPLSVVLDGGSGMAGTMLGPILKQLPITAHEYFLTPDGAFPDHQPNPLLEENRQFVISKVLEHPGSLGIAWDGDADRCFFIDEEGEFVPGDFVTALLAEEVLKHHPGATILYDVRASLAVPDTVARCGGTSQVSRVGHAFIKVALKESGGTFAGEVSGHYYFREFYGVDTGILPALLILQLVSRSGTTLVELLRPLRERYFITGEINSPVPDVALKLQELKDRYGPGATTTHLDGVSIEHKTWRFNVRPSNTEPLLRLNLEATNEAEMLSRRDEVLGVIRS